jgi:protein-L-isoaspartate(D-aspartate) O-methyltransferase
MFGSPRGSSDWKSETGKIDVPIGAREAIIRIGLFGATGELSLDNLRMKGLP